MTTAYLTDWTVAIVKQKLKILSQTNPNIMQDVETEPPEMINSLPEEILERIFVFTSQYK
jgi:hypothetical protein